MPENWEWGEPCTAVMCFELLSIKTNRLSQPGRDYDNEGGDDDTQRPAGKQDKWSSTSRRADLDSTSWEGRTARGFLYPSYWPALQRTRARGKSSVLTSLTNTSHFTAWLCLSLSPLSSLTPNIILRHFTRPPVFNRNSLFFCFLSEIFPPREWVWSVVVVEYLFDKVVYLARLRRGDQIIAVNDTDISLASHEEAARVRK